MSCPVHLTLRTRGASRLPRLRVQKCRATHAGPWGPQGARTGHGGGSVRSAERAGRFADDSVRPPLGGRGGPCGGAWGCLCACLRGTVIRPRLNGDRDLYFWGRGGGGVRGPPKRVCVPKIDRVRPNWPLMLGSPLKSSFFPREKTSWFRVPGSAWVGGWVGAG